MHYRRLLAVCAALVPGSSAAWSRAGAAAIFPVCRHLPPGSVMGQPVP